MSCAGADRNKWRWSTPDGRQLGTSPGAMDGRSSPPRCEWTRLRVILLGDIGVGKTSLMRRYALDKFDPQQDSTIVASEMEKKVRVDGQRYCLRIVDTAGQERFRSLGSNFYRGTNLCLLVFGLDSIGSFCNLTTWRAEFMAYSDIPKNADFPFVVVGNKADIPEYRRAVSDINARAWCAANGGAPYVEASAKDGLNVEEVFQAGIRRFLEFKGPNTAGKKDAEPRSRLSSKFRSQAQRKSMRAETVVLTADDITDMVVLEEKKCCSG